MVKETDGTTMANNSADWDFFLAHAGADQEKAESLYEYLADKSRVFLDSRCLRLGDDWDAELAAAQRHSLVTVVLVSINTEAAYYEREEVAAAIALARKDRDSHRVVPLYTDVTGSDDARIPYGLRLKHGISLGDDCTLADAAARLLDLRVSPSGRSVLSDAQKPTIVADESDQQQRWYGYPTVKPGYRNLVKAIGDGENARDAERIPRRRFSGAWNRWKAHMSSVWTFVRKPSNRRLLSWLGGGGAVAAAGIWAMVTYFWPANESPKVECVQQGVKIGGNVSGSTVTNTTFGRATAGPCVDSPKK
jgi:hypothetical protein